MCIVRGLNSIYAICHSMVDINFLSKYKTIATKKVEQNDT